MPMQATQHYYLSWGCFHSLTPDEQSELGFCTFAIIFSDLDVA
jgi:hypothetical protein